jgi:succinate dehydrogenase / fumarate reductase cytochrome b subunit
VAGPHRPYAAGAAAPRAYLRTSIGTKALMGATGLLLFLYLVLHVAGNLLVFFGPVVFNSYSHALISNPLVIPVEIGLVAVFLVHVYEAVTNYLANRRARPVRYHKSAWTGPPSRKGVASTTMILSGLVLLVFLVVHLSQFKYGPEYVVQQASPDAGFRDLYRLEVEVFGNALTVVFYLFCMVVVGTHLWHGVGSAFYSLGAEHPRYTPWVLRLGRVAATVIGLGFFVIPVWVFFVARLAAGG